MNEYIIVNKTTIQKRIEELEKEEVSEWSPGRRLWVDSAIKNLKEVLSQSTPLIPEIEKAIQFGKDIRSEKSVINENFESFFIDYEDSTFETIDYISNLKLDI